MTTALQLLPVKEQKLGVYDLQHFGMYFGFEVHEVQTPAKDIHKSWFPGEVFKKISADQTMAFYRLCAACLDYDPRCKEMMETGKHWTISSTMEVGAQLYRNYETGEIRFFVEPQVITTGTVDSRSLDTTRPPIDLITGEEMKDWWEKWHEYGRFHSHNTMAPTPSTVDDKSECKTPGVYCIFGNFRTKDGKSVFDTGPSIITPYPGSQENVRRTRIAEAQEDGSFKVRDLEYDDIFDWDPASKATFHENVWTNIMVEEPDEWKDEKPKWLGGGATLIRTGGYSYYEFGRSGGTSYDTSKKGSYPPVKAWDRFNEVIDTALDYYDIKKGSKEYDKLRWKLRVALNNLDELFEDFDTDLAVNLLDMLCWSEFRLELTRVEIKQDDPEEASNENLLSYLRESGYDVSED